MFHDGSLDGQACPIRASLLSTRIIEGGFKRVGTAAPRDVDPKRANLIGNTPESHAVVRKKVVWESRLYLIV